MPAAKPHPDPLETLEQVKKQYQRYVDLSGLYDLPKAQPQPPAILQPPSFDFPLTTHTFEVQ